ncbi:MAG: BrnT family toxin [Bacteriovorax sp.]|jgi:hypothetical protein
MAQWKFVEWLFFWILETDEFVFEWDKGNISKNNDKHNVTTDEAESVFLEGKALPLGVDKATINAPEERLGIIGRTCNGKVLQIAFVIRKKKVRIISARPANKKERDLYEESLRKIFEGL